MVAGLLREEVLNPRGDLPLERGLESKGSSPKRPRSLARRRSDMDERSSISQMSYHNTNLRKEDVEVYL